MKEQNFENLVARREGFSQSLQRLTIARQTIGTVDYPQRPDFIAENYSGLESLLVKVRVAEIKRQIDLKIPQVEQKVGEFEERIREISRVRELAERVPLIEELVKQGYLEEDDLAKARTFIQELPREGEAEPTAGKITAESKEERILLPDGQDVTNRFTASERLVVEGLLCGSQENPISSSELARFVYDEEAPIDVLKVRLSVRLTSIRRKLDKLGYTVTNLVPREAGRLGKEGLYYLAKKAELTEGEKK